MHREGKRRIARPGAFEINEAIDESNHASDDTEPDVSVGTDDNHLTAWQLPNRRKLRSVLLAGAREQLLLCVRVWEEQREPFLLLRSYPMPLEQLNLHHNLVSSIFLPLSPKEFLYRLFQLPFRLLSES